MPRGYIVPIGGAEEKLHDPTILRRFARLCGGEAALIAIIPTASELDSTGPRYVDVFRAEGVRRAVVLDYQERRDTRREDWLQTLALADGVFITGGNQLRLSTVLGGTPVSDALRRRNKDGMHVGGTSAGAAILSEHMIAYGAKGRTPRSGMVTLAPGLGLFPDAIIDQHFRQRGRLGRLLTALSYNPRLTGVGLDEDTAAFIGPDGELEVEGSGDATILDTTDLEYSSIDVVEPDDAPLCILGVRMHLLSAGARYHFETRVASPPRRKRREAS